MKIIFLDIDGVLNTSRFICERIEQGADKKTRLQWVFDPIAMKNLQEIVKKTGAKIVISSTWKLHEKYNDDTWKALLKNLRDWDIEDAYIGVTPRTNEGIRGREIKDWLESNNYLGIESFVIIDDDSDMEELKETHLVKCSTHYGLTTKVKKQALEILG